MAASDANYYTNDVLSDQTMENAGYYTQDDQCSIFVHRARDGNFQEAIGSRYIISNISATTGVFAAAFTPIFRFKALGNLITLQLNGNSNGASALNTATTVAAPATNTINFPQLVPAPDVPFRDVYIPILLYNNGALVTSYAWIRGRTAPAGNVGDLNLVLGTGNFSGASTCGFAPTDLTWDCKY